MYFRYLEVVIAPFVQPVFGPKSSHGNQSHVMSAELQNNQKEISTPIPRIVAVICNQMSNLNQNRSSGSGSEMSKSFMCFRKSDSTSTIVVRNTGHG